MGCTGAAEISGGGVAGGVWGAYVGAGIGTSDPGLLNEPIGGGAVDTMGADTGAGMSEPGSGGAVAVEGRAIWPISGTMLGTAVIGGFSTAGEEPKVSSLSAMTVCTVASTHSVPQAITEERSRSEARMVEGGVTSC